MPDPIQAAVPAAPEPAAVSTSTPPALSPQQIRHKDLIDEYEIVVPGEDEPPQKVAPVAETPVRPVPPSPAVQPKQQHSRRALLMAQDFGIPQSEIDAATPDELDGIVYHLNRQFLSRAREATQAPRQAPAENPTPPPDEIDWGEHKDDATGQVRKFKDDDFHPALASILKSQAKQIKELQAALGTINQREQVREVESTAEKIDRYFDELQSPTFGKGSWRHLNGKPEYARRIAVLNEAIRLAGPNSTKEQQLVKLAEARQNLYPDEQDAKLRLAQQPKEEPPKAAARDPQNGRFTAQQQRWLDAGIARPTQRSNAEEPLGKQRATNALQSKMEAAGYDYTDEGGAAELKDELPD